MSAHPAVEAQDQAIGPAQPTIVHEPRNLTADAFRALGDPLRLELMAYIAANGPVCVCHIEQALGYLQPRISKHLGILRRAGLVSARREANWVYYEVSSDGLEATKEYLGRLSAATRRPHLTKRCAPRAPGGSSTC